jgi:hypothetical protein
MNKTKEMWQEVKKRNNTITTGFDYDTGHDETCDVELSDVMDVEEIQMIDDLIAENEDLKEKLDIINKERLNEDKKLAYLMGDYISEAKYDIIGRGTVYVVDMNDYPGRSITVGDTICIDNIVGIVRGIEGSRNLFGEMNPKIGIILVKL